MASARRSTLLKGTKNGAQRLYSNAAVAAMAVAGIAAVGGAFALGRAAFAYRRTDRRHSGAFAHGETDLHNFDQTRSAGPTAMRDQPADHWDKVDQASDESFPASDPMGVSHVD